MIEFARDIANGERDMVLIAGAEALKNQRHADRKQKELPDFSLNWHENFNQPLKIAASARCLPHRKN
ncbi:hypothetical protein [Oceanicoccus sp. KOV_DT_Chl]|uniref:hypothetical protein n=1 Tax=Oceanicoccus sp. KOV_DT_Chl TaxID=1904639 RepID=UPI000C7C3BEA|nr:hypothetical protein [Oceanicoccus sp. KOV_DT_Chl]